MAIALGLWKRPSERPRWPIIKFGATNGKLTAELEHPTWSMETGAKQIPTPNPKDLPAAFKKARREQTMSSFPARLSGRFTIIGSLFRSVWPHFLGNRPVIVNGISYRYRMPIAKISFIDFT